MLLAIPGVASAGSITYQINNYPAVQNGFSLSGTITTDGTIGDLAVKDITAWSWTITELGLSYTYKSTDKNVFISLRGQLTATATQITMPPALDVGRNKFFFVDKVKGETAALIWAHAALETTSYVYADYVTAAGTPLRAWYTHTDKLGGQTVWVIASVPEPSALHLAGIAFGCGVFYVSSCQSKSRSRARSGV